MTESRPDDDTAEQQVLRFDDVLPGGHEPASTAASTPPRRRGHWVAAAVVLAVVAIGIAGLGLTRQSTASANPPAPAPPAVIAVTPSPTDLGGTGAGPMLPSGQDTLVLGDSLALIMYPWLADLLPDRYVSYGAEVGASAEWARAHLEQMKQAGEKIPKVVLVSAGTNDFYASGFATDVAGVLELLGPKRCVVWADIARPDVVNGTTVDPASRLNEVLAAAARTHPNLHLLGWEELSAEHPGWLAGDGVHPIEEGARARAEQYAAGATACSPLDPEAPTANKQVLPTSVFYGGSTSVPGTSSSSGGGYTPAPARTTTPEPSPTRSRTTRPSRHPAATPEPTASPEPTISQGPATKTPPPPEPSHGDDPPAPPASPRASD